MPDCIDIETHCCKQPIGGNEDHTWTAWYAEDDPNDSGLDFGLGSTKLRAIANLLDRFPRDDAGRPLRRVA